MIRKTLYILNNIYCAYKEYWLKATDFTGKTTLADWWSVQLVNCIISIIFAPIFFKIFDFNIYALFCFLPQLSMNIRRLRDFGKNWKWIFINFVPVIGWIIWFIWIGLGKTGKGLNKFI